MTGEARRIGAVHALTTDVAIFCFLGSWVARRRGRHATGVALAVSGNAAGAVAGLLGGHLALTRGTARRQPQVLQRARPMSMDVARHPGIARVPNAAPCLSQPGLHDG